MRLLVLSSTVMAFLAAACLQKREKTDNPKPRAQVPGSEKKADEAKPQTLQNLSYHKDIRPLVEEKCLGCHGDDGLSSINFSDYGKVKKFAAQIKDSIVAKRMPPWIADSGHQTYKDDLSLSDDARKVFASWVDQGSVEGNKKDYSAPAKREYFTPDVTYKIFVDDGVYLPKQETADDYRCFVLPFGDKLDAAGYITGFTATPGNKKLVHHLVAYLVDAEIVPFLSQLDEEEPGRGYQCHGGATPDRLASPEVQAALEAKFPGSVAKINASNYWLAHWAPGMEGGYVFPDKTGIQVPPGGAFVIQMHYYTAEAKGQSDQGTNFGLKTAKSVPKPAFYYPLTDQQWLLSKANKSMLIKPKSEATFSTEKSLQHIAGYGMKILGLKDGVKAIEAHSANLHLHAFGKSGIVTQGKTGGADPEILLKISKWDLHWQRDFQFEPKSIPLADTAQYTRRVSCTYYNDGDTEVFGGFGSYDEMCFDFGYFAFDLGQD